MYLEFKRNPEIPTEPETRLCVLSVLVTPTPTATPLAMPPLSLSHSFHPACSFCCACPLRSQPSCAALLNFTQILKMKSKFSYYNDYFETIPTAHSPQPTPPPHRSRPFPPAVLFFSFSSAQLLYPTSASFSTAVPWVDSVSFEGWRSSDLSRIP